jgi:hypothetical protein
MIYMLLGLFHYLQLCLLSDTSLKLRGHRILQLMLPIYLIF